MTGPEPAPLEVVDDVFKALGGQLGAKVVNLYGVVPTDDVRTEWAMGLAGFHPSEIARGLARCRTREFAPVIGEFARLCRPALDAEIAWLEAQAGMADRAKGGMGRWTHPAVYRAACGFEHELRVSTFAAQRKAWEWRLTREFDLGWAGEWPSEVPMHTLLENRP